MNFFNSNRENKYGTRAGLLGHKSASKSNPSSPLHPTHAPRSSPPPKRPRENGKERAEDMSYADVTPGNDDASVSPFRSEKTHTPDRRSRSTDFSRKLQERMYEAEANVSPFHPSRSSSPAPTNTLGLHHDRGRDYSRERYDA
ncbi:hypothetical protein Bca52824_002959 [Brassica carinata]|uniref:Uncharacterized protein n=1 Tax=Brassica carinata TaxID=52824 RepID=A0A8X8BB14_BRACI|nr:hypothetical protein Bca52824_002959 [Brassica carinata]